MNVKAPTRKRNPDSDKFTIEKWGKRDQLICRETLLPAYDSMKHHSEVSAKNFPGVQIEKQWRCVHCGKYHVTGYFPRGSNNKHMRTEKTLQEALNNES